MLDMGVNLYILKSSGRLTIFAKQIEKEFYSSIDRINRVIPIPEVDVVLYDNPDGVIPELGISGYTPYSYLVMLSIDPDFPDLTNSISKQFKRILTHELHHALRWKTPGYGSTLLEALISEGLADCFDMEINNALPQIWDKALNKKQFEKMKEMAEREYFNEDYNHSDWFLGSKERDIPRWAGYSLGFYFVNKYLELHPNKKPSELCSLNTKEFIK